MKFVPRVVLAIAPGKRECGVAVFGGIELVDFSIKSFQKRRSDKLLKDEIGRLMQELVESFKPDVIIVRHISQYQTTSPTLAPIINVINREAQAKQIPTIGVSLEQVKSLLGDNEKATQGNIFNSLTAIYPELRQFSGRPNRWQNDYYNNLFSAVAVGVVFLKSLGKSN